MESIKDFICSEYESKKYSIPEIVDTNNKLIEWLQDSNKILLENE